MGAEDEDELFVNLLRAPESLIFGEAAATAARLSRTANASFAVGLVAAAGAGTVAVAAAAVAVCMEESLLCAGEGADAATTC